VGERRGFGEPPLDGREIAQGYRRVGGDSPARIGHEDLHRSFGEPKHGAAQHIRKGREDRNFIEGTGVRAGARRVPSLDVVDGQGANGRHEGVRDLHILAPRRLQTAGMPCVDDPVIRLRQQEDPVLGRILLDLAAHDRAQHRPAAQLDPAAERPSS
jgi:hypothetical protein